MRSLIFASATCVLSVEYRILAAPAGSLFAFKVDGAIWFADDNISRYVRRSGGVESRTGDKESEKYGDVSANIAGAVKSHGSVLREFLEELLMLGHPKLCCEASG